MGQKNSARADKFSSSQIPAKLCITYIIAKNNNAVYDNCG